MTWSERVAVSGESAASHRGWRCAGMGDKEAYRQYSTSLSKSPVQSLTRFGVRRMQRDFRDGTLGVVIIVLLAMGGVRAEAATGREGQQRPVDHTPVTQAASAALGRIVGAVTDRAGNPLDGAAISAFGPAGAELALADADGRFTLRSLAPGAYLVQAHLLGFAASRRELVEVSASTPTEQAFILSRVGLAVELIAAGIGLPIRADAGTQPADADADETLLEGAGAKTSTVDDHSEKAWRLLRARRSVLKDAHARVAAGAPGVAGESSAGPNALLTHSLGSPMRFATGLLDLPLTGEVNLLTRGTLDQAQDMITAVPGSAGVANLSVGAPVWDGDWLAQGAMSTGDLRSWVASGAYIADAGTAHRLGFDLSYGRQRYDGGNPAALTVASENRYAASFGASDSWTVSPWLTVDYGGRYATYGYLEEDGLFSSRVAMMVMPVAGLRIRVGGSQETVAPGAEEFLPPPDAGLWLPPERTFAAFSPLAGLHPERTRHLDVGLEYDLTDSFVVGVRRYYQGVSDQMATLFGVDELGNAPTGHYYYARAGSVTSRGWVLTLRRQLGDRFSGSVDYAIAEAHWRQTGADAALGAALGGATRPAVDRFHDVSGAVETEIPGTATRLFVRCRVSNAFVGAGSVDATRLDARFDVRVNHALPFSPFDGSRWEVLVAVRSLFFEPQDGASTFDELLVARSPRQFVGGLVVHF